MSLSYWYRGESTNLLPDKEQLAADGAAERYILAGHLPQQPFIKKNTIVSAFGSCFASKIYEYLQDKGYLVNQGRSYLFSHQDSMVNTFSLREQVEWALSDKPFKKVWFPGKGVELSAGDESVRQATRQAFLKTSVFIVTLGLSEVWYDKKTDEVFWKGVPQEHYDPNRHAFKVVTFSENKQNIGRIVRLIKEKNPRASLIFTVSPIPLLATFRPISCITADSASKALLKASLDEWLRQADMKDVYYWPAYELVKHYLPDPYQRDNRHITTHASDAIMRLFAKYYLA
jgi:hypothetical protein